MLWIRLNKIIKIPPCILTETLTVRFLASRLILDQFWNRCYQRALIGKILLQIDFIGWERHLAFINWKTYHIFEQHFLERFNGYSQPPPPQNGNINVQPRLPTSDQMPEIRKYKKRFNSEINCASLWGVNLLIGTNNGLLLLDRSGQVSFITFLSGILTVRISCKLCI